MSIDLLPAADKVPREDGDRISTPVSPVTTSQLFLQVSLPASLSALLQHQGMSGPEMQSP
ncbi:hypothetical protein [Gluconobacter oxydans]|uniref:hypothetical protein n=1 Tax=Gluconobacter oxydans TaxID=442 RepID=UPI00155891BC|nr:hypothetical protein [Gluconobacter oxydans]